MIGKRKGVWLVVGATIVVLYLLFMDKQDIDAPISRNQVVSTEMSVAVYTKAGGGAHVSFEDVTLSKEDISRIVGWMNADPESTKMPVDHITGSISAGITLKLKHNAEVTLEYNLKHIVVTRTSRFNRVSKYVLDQKDLREFMDQKLEGTFFGEDPVSYE